MTEKRRSGGLKLRHVFAIAVGMHAGDIATPLALENFDDHLRARGMDPAIAQGLSDRRIYVHSDRNSTLAYDILKPSMLFSAPKSPYALMGVYDRVVEQCRVFLFDVDPNEMVARVAGVPVSEVRDLSYLKEAFNNYITLHEARHCHSDNRVMEDHSSEADADIHALRAMAGDEYARELAAVVRHWRALGLMRTASHDTSLSLYADLRGAPLPSEAEIVRAERQILSAIATDVTMSCHIGKMFGIDQERVSDAMSRTIEQSMKDDPAFIPAILQKLYDEGRFNGAARARVSQYLAAVRYLLPAVAEELRGGEAPEWRCAPL